VKKVAQKLAKISLIFKQKTAPSKHPPNRRKFAQSGHPVHRGLGLHLGRFLKAFGPFSHMKAHLVTLLFDIPSGSARIF
jgi:hypothetical protein